MKVSYLRTFADRITMKPLLLCMLLSMLSLEKSFAESERALGNTEAPVTLVEYGSLTCDYCIHFHRQILPLIQKTYIEPGKVRFIYRDFPTSQSALKGAAAARCSGDQYYDFLSQLFNNVASWAESDEIEAALSKEASIMGLEKQNFLTCIQDSASEKAVHAQQQSGRAQHGVIGTPTFLINGKRLRGKQSFETLEKVILEALSASTTKAN